MRPDLNISFHLDHFYYHNENYEWTTEMPRYWFSFFKIDGSGCKLNESLRLEGKAVVYSPFEKMENLNSIEPDKQDVLRIPYQLGYEEINLKPIPVPEFVKKSGIESVESYAGCIVVLMNEYCASNDEKNTYSQLLTTTIQNSLDRLIPHLNHDNKNIPKHLETMQQEIDTVILQESEKNQSFWKRLTTESIVNSTVWKFSSDELSNMNSVSLTKYWGRDGLWELSGDLKIKKPKSQNRSKTRKIQTMKTP